MNQKQFDITGKYWIKPDGSLIDCRDSEHAFYARAAMLNLTPEEARREFGLNDIFDPLTDEEKIHHRARGVSICVIQALSKPAPDPRIFVIREWGWIRTKDNRFYVSRLTSAKIRRILDCADFWKMQSGITEHACIIVSDLEDSEEYTFKLADLRLVPVKIGDEKEQLLCLPKTGG